MSRITVKSHKEKLVESSSEVLDKKIDALRFKIKSSQNKLDDYIDNVNTKVVKIISSRLNKFKVIH